MFIVHANRVSHEYVKDRIQEGMPASDIIAVVDNMDQVKQAIVEHAKDRVNEDYADGMASTREQTWLEYCARPDVTMQIGDGSIIINHLQYHVSESK